MKTKISVIILLLNISFSTLFSQQINDTIVPKETIVRFHILPVGLSIEQHIVKHTTILYEIGAGFSFQNTEIYDDEVSDFKLKPKLIPFMAFEPRIYTNLHTRNAKGKRTDYYSGSYGAVRLQGGMDLESEYWYIQLGPLVGFQRTLRKKGYWNIGIGCGSTINEKDIKFGLIGDFKIGFIID